MNRSISTKRCTFFLLLFLNYFYTFAQQLSYNHEVLDDALELEIINAPQATQKAYVLLKDQVDIAGLNQQFNTLRASKAQRARTVVNALIKKADQTQGRLLTELQQAIEVVPGSIQPFWITNMIQIEATGAYLAQLSYHPAVQRIEKVLLDQIHEAKASTAFDLAFADNSREQGLTTINAHKLWELGYTGYGTTVMVIDTDIDFTHRALKTQFLYNNEPFERAFTGEIGGQICFNHGTNVVGLIVGIDRLRNDTIGAAFNAKYINGPVPFADGEGNQCELEGNTLTPVQNLQFALDPDGNPNTTDDIPDVVNNSYGTQLDDSRDCLNRSYRNVIESLDAAGVSVIFSAGNDGPEESTLSIQASLNFDPLAPLVVGSIDNNNAISDFSSRGPNVCINGPDRFKPDLVAPGSLVRTTRPSNGYEEISGTSFSTPYVAGGILLLKEAFPNLTGRQLNEAVLATARDLGDEGEDHIYGLGLIDLFAAYNWLMDQGHTPTPALRTANDAILVDVETRSQDCNRMIQSFLTVANNGTEDITSLDVTYQRESDRGSLGTATWTGRIEPGTSKRIIIDPVNAFTGEYTVQVGIENVNGRADLRSLDNFIKAEVNVAPDPIETEITIAGRQLCQGGQSMLTATSAFDGSLQWYDALERGNLVAEGNTVLLENVQKDTTLYLATTRLARVGLAQADLGPNTFLSQRGGLVFDAEAAFILKSVKIFAESPGVRIIQLRNPDGDFQQRVIPLTSVGEQEIELNFSILPGQNLELIMSVGNGLAVTTNQTEFPYIVEDVVSINRSTGTVATFYAYFYDWQIEAESSCGRIAANIQVDETGIAPNVDFIADNYVIDLIEGVGAAVAFTSTSDELVSYSWNFGDGFTSSQANPIYSYTEPGIYNVTLYGTDADGCSNMAVQTIEVRSVVSTQEQDRIANQIDVFPTPAKDQVNLSIQFSDSKVVQYEILDVLGKSYGRKNLGAINALQSTVDISNLPEGTYLLRLNVDGVQVGKRLVKLQ